MALLQDPSRDVRAEAARALGQLGASAEIVAELMDVVRRGPSHAKLAALQALSWLDAPSTFTVLVKALDDSNAEIRQAAVSALGELAERRAIPHLLARLAKDRAPGVRTEAAFRLGKLDGPVVLPALRMAAADRDARVRWWAEAAINSIQASQGE
jgi:HEAT repeat protein